MLTWFLEELYGRELGVGTGMRFAAVPEAGPRCEQCSEFSLFPMPTVCSDLLARFEPDQFGDGGRSRSLVIEGRAPVAADPVGFPCGITGGSRALWPIISYSRWNPVTVGGHK